MTEKVRYYQEICCERCGDVIHNHFDCPSCGEKGAATSAYRPISEGDEVSCEECGTAFDVEGVQFQELELEQR